MKPCIVLQSDFGISTGLPASMTAVITKIDSEIRIYDLCHEVREYDIRQGGSILKSTYPYWPDGTVFVSVVDPGVGTTRRSCVAKLDNGSYIVTPDNGTLSYVVDHVVAVRQIDETVNRLPGSGDHHTFHGRDVYAYTAARLASGIITYEEVGPKYDTNEIKKFDIKEATINKDSIEGIFEINDPNFGNLWTNIYLNQFKEFGFEIGDNVHVTVYHNDDVVFDKVIPYYDSFGKAPDHSVMVYNNELNKMALAEVVGNLCNDYNLGYGIEYKVVFKHE